MARILKRPMFNRGGSSNQGIMDGLVDRTGLAEGTPLFDKETTAAQVKAITEAHNEFSPLPETRLPIGQLGSDLMRGLGFRDSAAYAYDSFVTADDKRRAAMAGRTSSAVSTSLGQQIAERNAKLKAMGSSNMQKDYTNLRQFETAVDNRIKQRREIKSYDDVPVDLAYIRGASEYDVDVSRNLRTTQNPQGQEINQLKREILIDKRQYFKKFLLRKIKEFFIFF